MKPLRIAMIGSLRSIHTRTYVEYLVGRGHRVVVVGDDADDSTGIPTMSLGPVLQRPSPWLLSRLVRRMESLRAAIAKADPDVVNVQFVGTDAVLFAAAGIRVPMVLSFYGSDIHGLAARPWYMRAAMRWLLHRAHHIHSVSEHMAAELVRFGADPGRISTFQYGVDLEVFSMGAVPRGSRVIVSTRNLSPLYRVEQAIRAMSVVVSRVPGCRLRVVGSGPDSERLVDLTSELGLVDHVTFVGPCPPGEVAEELRAASVWISLPPRDGTPLSLLEAMACGAIPVAADVPSLHEWVSGRDGVLLSDCAPESIAAGIVQALAMAADARHAMRNRVMVESRGDQTVNLAMFEELLLDAAGDDTTSQVSV